MFISTYEDKCLFDKLLLPSFGKFVTADRTAYNIHLDWKIAVISVVVALIAIGIATMLYMKESKRPAALANKIRGLYNASYNKFYIDEVYMFITKKIIFNSISRPFAWFDRHVVDGAMNGMAWVTGWTSEKTKRFQSGSLQWYAWVFLAGILLITALAVLA